MGFKTTRWTTDPYARGSYSSLWVRSTDKEWYSLARPESPSLYFAGEHTNYDGRYQALDGAYNTGIREAERIAARPWNADVVSQTSDWMNKFAYTSGWSAADDDSSLERRALRQNRGAETKVKADPKLYKVTRKVRLGPQN